VIVPFLARELRPPSQRYPHFVKSPTTGELLIAFGKEDKTKELKETIERAQQQEQERLLYVATTRARHTLVLVLDQEIFSTNDGDLPKTAQLRRLVRNHNCYSGELDGQSNTIDQIRAVTTTIGSVEKNESVRIDPLTSRDLRRAAQRSSKFVHKLTPSALDPELPMEGQARPRAENLPALYGRWWHKFFERLDWRAGIDSAQQLFETQLVASPDPESAIKHWKATTKNLFSDASIARFLESDDTIFHAELPFSWRRNDRSVIEGLIDSLMIDRRAGRSLLIDWKTNDVSPADAEMFRARYRPQLAAYWKAVAQITTLDVQAGLFSTALGRLLIYSADELETEWRRLEQLPPTLLQAEIQGDGSDDLD
jgi:ATP-dependent exoDNAse (exonuclease V) beta subunit